MINLVLVFSNAVFLLLGYFLNYSFPDSANIKYYLSERQEIDYLSFLDVYKILEVYGLNPILGNFLAYAGILVISKLVGTNSRYLILSSLLPISFQLFGLNKDVWIVFGIAFVYFALSENNFRIIKLIFGVYIIGIVKVLYIPLFLFLFIAILLSSNRSKIYLLVYTAGLTIVITTVAQTTDMISDFYQVEANEISTLVSGFGYAETFYRFITYLIAPIYDLLKGINIYGDALASSAILLYLNIFHKCKGISISRSNIYILLITILVVSLFIPFIQLRYLVNFLLFAFLINNSLKKELQNNEFKKCP